MNDLKPVFGVLLIILSVSIALSLFVGGLVYYKDLDTEATAAGLSHEEQVGQIGPVILFCILGSLVIGCFGFFIGLYLINPWLPATYMAAKYLRNNGESDED